MHRNWVKKDEKILLGTVALVVLAASAADLAARLSERSGSYIGINSGGGPARRCWHLVNAGVVVRAPPLAIRGHSATGGPLGGEIRFRWQIANSVFGIGRTATALISRTPTLTSLS
ncbi:hypothetical protein [Bradyrhizobium sp. RDI18]|uniref:hypothetical protein n=1 Tax=Bradyrhizobium sp. RDI18 TaxID=3367400 RepID=UPI0037146105